MKVSEAMQEGSASLTMTQASAATLPQDVASALFAISAGEDWPGESAAPTKSACRLHVPHTPHLLRVKNPAGLGPASPAGAPNYLGTSRRISLRLRLWTLPRNS